MAIVMTAAKLIEAAKHIALKRNTYYDNSYPNNLGYYHENGYLSFDCWNTIKAIIWTAGAIKDNKTVGEFAHPNLSTGLGDWTGRQILNACSKVSDSFTSITPGAFLLTPDDDHAGLYVGDFTVNSKTYNVIETTGSWGGGTLCSYVDAYGKRYNHKGGTQNYRWGWHGLMPWIDYADTPEPEPEPTEDITISELALEIYAGKWGNNPERKENITAKYGAEKYQAAQTKVNSIVANISSEELILKLAKEVIAGKWGNNPGRKKDITAQYGENTYKAVQEKVNSIMS